MASCITFPTSEPERRLSIRVLGNGCWAAEMDEAGKARAEARESRDGRGGVEVADGDAVILDDDVRGR